MNPQRRFRGGILILVVCLSLACPGASQLSRPSGEASVHGTVCDSTHHPLAGADVSLQSKTGTQTWRTRSDSTGAFEFSGLPSGNYTVRAETGTKQQAVSPTISLAAKETKRIELTVSAPGLTFFDEPAFSVAGVTDTTNLGGHGSDTVVRTKNALAKETVSLGKDGASHSAAPSAVAEDSLRRAQEREPRSFATNYQLGKFLSDSGRDADAKPYLSRASEIAAENTLLQSRDKADLHHVLGNVAEKTGDSLTAVREYQLAAELDQNERNIFDWGGELLLHHAPEPAAEVFANGSRQFPQSVRMRVGLGVAWYVRGSYDQAARQLCEAADLAPNNAIPYLFLGKILNAESNVSPEIAERLARFAANQPDSATANYYYAVSLWKQRKGPNDDETAARVQSLLEKAATLDPGMATAFLELGIVHAERKEFLEAIAAYQKAIQADSRLEPAHYRLAQAYRINGQNEKAQQELKVYEELSKQSAAQSARERTDVKQFVYTLREQGAAGPQP